MTRRGITYFLPLFFLAVAAGFVPLPPWVNVVLAVVLVGAYAYYAFSTIKGAGGEEDDSPEDLLLWPEPR